MGVKGKFLISFIITIGLILSVLVCSAESEYEVLKDFSTGALCVSGEAEQGDIITIQIFRQGMTMDEFLKSENKNELVILADDCVVDENCKFAFSTNVGKSDTYTGYISEKENGVSKIEIGYFADKAQYENAVNEVNGAFEEKFSENISKLGFDDPINEKIDMTEVCRLLYNELEGNKIVASEFVSNVWLYKKCAAIIALNSSKIENASDYILDLVEDDEKLLEFWNTHIVNDVREKYFTKKLSGRNIKDMDDLKIEAKKALILTVVKYPDGYGNIKKIFTEYKDLLNLNKVSDNDSVYKTLASKGDYNSIDELIDDYNKAVKNAENPKDSSRPGGGGGVSSGGGREVKNDSPVAVVGSTTQSKGTEKKELSLKFKDLNDVPWAYPSISVLYEEGIINGINEYEFVPNEAVKREEFVKMLAEAMRLDDDSNINIFSDVPENEWYTKYINAAYQNGIVKGISETEFGVSLNITRQDMAVMLYNAIKLKPEKEQNVAVNFMDMDEISEYAKIPVSALAEKKIVTGTGDNLFSPQNNATRAEAAVIIERALAYLR